MTNPSRRAVLAASGTALAGALAGCSGGGGGGGGGSESDAVANAPLPADTSTTYATMGSADADAHVTYVGNWKCPYCAQFDTGWFPEFVTDYVETAAVQLTYRALAYTPSGEPFLGEDASRAARAGLSLWDAAPESYWRFHTYVFANQPPEDETWATTDRLVSMMESAGVSADVRSTVRADLEGTKYSEAVRETTTFAQNNDISGTPMLVVDGDLYNPLQEEDTRAAIENATST
ncbi:DsbA family protein [Halocalculus aciditolerans]|uniref:Thioredoxin-like fold domain-containing protein n=1 Tax=Halocalculus aciditolerans TaxID=1383812 RepID=A0A830FDS3_9EURY|nr:thioredoxin domain-containing protein [Halocalculus aciditolerans]GGL64689.1 hypothetical protein GCM10009039_23340 [Halocalculus aciditolerans]